MDYTRFTNVEVTGELKAGSLRGDIAGNVSGNVSGLLSGVSISKAASYTLADTEKVFCIGVTMTAASQTLTLGLPDGMACIVVNTGDTNAFTLKNVAGDSGTSVAAGKAYLVLASTTANGSKLTLLNDGT